MKFIGVISDTHGLLRPEAKQVLSGCDCIIHAGDIGRPEVLDELQLIAPVQAVRGNVDKGDWAASMPETEVVCYHNQYIYVLHNLDELDLDPQAAGFQVVISGHSHQPKIQQRGEVLYFNPGSAGPRRFKLPITVGRLSYSAGQFNAEIIDLE